MVASLSVPTLQFENQVNILRKIVNILRKIGHVFLANRPFLNPPLHVLKVELNVDMLDPLTFRVVERLIREALKASAVSMATVSAMSSSSVAKSKPSSGGHKKRRGSEGEPRLKKQRA